MANRVLALIRKIFNFGIAREVVEFNPSAQIERPGKERQRHRVLSDEEIRAFWMKLDQEQVEVAAAFRLRLVTAQRGGEVFDMRWADVDLVPLIFDFFKKSLVIWGHRVDLNGGAVPEPLRGIRLFRRPAPVPTFARISSAVFVHLKGLPSSLWAST